jgi:cytochrome P450
MPRFAYFPFGGGPRLCIGNNFALMEAQLILATLAQRFRPKLHQEAKVELDPQVTLRPKYGMRMWIERA